MSVEGTLGAVVVGTGIGALTHVPALRAAGFDVRGLVGRDPDKTARRAAVLGVAPCTSVDEALALPGVDVVTVATPPFSHAPIVLKAVAAGKNVLCEKAFARDVDEAVAMYRAAEAAGIVHLLGTEYRFSGAEAHFTDLIQGGAIGEPRFALFIAQLGALAGADVSVPSWFESAEDGGSWFFASGAHPLDNIRIALGEFDQVTATLQTMSTRARTADDLFNVAFVLESGVEGILHGSCAVRGNGVRITKVEGTKGSLWLEGVDVWIDDGSGQRVVPLPERLVAPPPTPAPAALLETTYERLHSRGLDVHPYTQVYTVMRARIRGEAVAPGPPAATFADGVAMQAVVDAVRHSAAEHITVKVNTPKLT